MNNILLLITLIALATSIKAFFACRSKALIMGKPWKICEPMGSFVWADHILFGPFWALTSLFCFLIQDTTLFLLIVSVFWMVRSGGEILYWFLQQFHPRPGNEPKNFWINRYAPGDAVWFLHQIFWQCILVISIITSLYTAFIWLS